MRKTRTAHTASSNQSRKASRRATRAPEEARRPIAQANKPSANQPQARLDVFHAMSADGLATSSKISVADVRRLAGHMLKTVAANPDMSHLVPRLMVWGPPGVGKSKGVEGMCEEYGINFHDFRPAESGDPMDVGGVRVPDTTLGSDTFGTLRRYVPQEYPKPDSNEPALVHFDELASADRASQVACYQVLLDRRLGNAWKAPKKAYFMASGNSKADKSVSNAMSAALANRLCHLEVAPNLEQTVQHFAQIGRGDADESKALTLEQRREKFMNDIQAYKLKNEAFSPTVISFLKAREMYFHGMQYGNPERGWPSPRSWEQVSFVTKLADQNAISENDLNILTQGLVGPGVAIEYMAFRKQAVELPEARKILSSTQEAKAYAFPPNDKPDLRWASSSNFAYAMFEPNRETTKEMIDNFYVVLTNMPPDYAMATLKTVFQSANDKEKGRLFMSANIGMMVTKHGKNFDMVKLAQTLKKT